MECKKPCGTKICNPKTGRCVKKSGRIGKKNNDCDPDKIRNPLTGRCVKKSGEIAKLIAVTKLMEDDETRSLSKDTTKQFRKNKIFKKKNNDCDPDKIRNPLTGRCVKKSGRIGKSILQTPEINNIGKSGNEIIYNPYYRRKVNVNSDENCGKNRPSMYMGMYSEFNRENVMKYLCDVIPLKDVETIIGPVAYSEYKYGDIIISVFGETHSLYDYTKCMNHRTVTFGSFLSMLLSANPSKTYDLYLETGYINTREPDPREIGDNNFTIYAMEKLFQDCLKVNKQLCPFDNLRAHYIDIRHHVITDNIKRLHLYFLSDLFRNALAGRDFANLVLDDIYSILTKHPLIQKELSKSYLEKDIKDFVMDRFSLYNNYREIPWTNTELMQAAALIMDIYTLSRMFRNFADKTMNKNIIIYAGDAHAGLYRDFFEVFLGLVPTLEIRSDFDMGYSSCLNFKAADKKKSYLFSSHPKKP